MPSDRLQLLLKVKKILSKYRIVFDRIFLSKMIFKGRLCLPQTIDEESDEDEFIIEYVTDSEEENAAGSDEEW